MKVTTSPAGRFGWKGSTLDYTVKAEGATELKLPEQECPGVKTQLTDIKRTADGVEARLRLDVRGTDFN